MAQAKTASKNNPTSRQKAREVLYNGEKVVPVMLISDEGKLMAAKFEKGDNLAKDDRGNPIPWNRVSN